MAPAETRAQYWATLISQWRDSGLSQAEFCRRRGISDSSLSNWLHKKPYVDRVEQVLAARSQAQTELPGFVPIRLVSPAPQASPAPAPAPAPIEVVLPGGARISVTPGFDSQTLCQLLDVLETRRC